MMDEIRVCVVFLPVRISCIGNNQSSQLTATRIGQSVHKRAREGPLRICKYSMFATGKPVRLAMRASTDRTVASLAHDPVHQLLEEERKSPPPSF